MATKYWLGVAQAVAQVSTGSIDTVDGTPSNDTFTVTIGGVAVSVTGDTDVATTATALRAALNASTHPYFAAITWSGTSGDIIGTADTAGVPFTAALTQSGGTGTVTDFASTTANAGPNDWSTASNWSDGSIPANSDTVIIDGPINIFWGLAQSAVALTKLEIRKSFTGKIGLPWSAFTTDGAGSGTQDETIPEYRATYLDIVSTDVVIGETFGPDAAALTGSTRVKLDLGDTATTVDIHDTAQTSAEVGKPALRLLFNNDNSDIFIRKSIGGVGIASDVPGETSTLRKVSVGAAPDTTRVFVGEGVTFAAADGEFEQSGGVCRLSAAADLVKLDLFGGECETEGEFAVTTANINGGEFYPNHVPSSGAAITTFNCNAGLIDTTRSTEARTFTTVTRKPGVQFVRNTDNITITTLADESSQRIDEQLN